MEASEITRRNVAIARYMGWEKNEAELWNPQPVNTYSDDALRFHSDWNWLMPAVEKVIQETGAEFELRRDDIGDGMAGHYCWFRAMPYGRLSIDIQAAEKTMIGAVWMIVSDYCLSLEKPASDG